MPQDWFEQNAPQTDDWFAANAPKAKQADPTALANQALASNPKSAGLTVARPNVPAPPKTDGVAGRVVTQLGAKAAEMVPTLPTSRTELKQRAIGAANLLTQGQAGSVLRGDGDLQSTQDDLAGMMGINAPAIREAASNRDYSRLAVEAAVPIAGAALVTNEKAMAPIEKAATTAGDIGTTLSGKVGAATRPTVTMGERVVGTLSKTAAEEGFQFAPKDVPTAFRSLSDQFIGRAKSAYQAIDKAVDGELQPVLDKITDLKKSIKTQKNLDPEKADALLEQLDEMQQRKTEVLGKAKAAGMENAEEVLAQADKDYSRGKALEAMTKKVRSASGEARHGGKTDPSKFATMVDNATNNDKLRRGLGPEAVSELQGHARNALQTKKRLATAGSLAGKAAKYGTIGALAGGGVLAGKKLLEDQ